MAKPPDPEDKCRLIKRGNKIYVEHDCGHKPTEEFLAEIKPQGR